MCEFMFVWVRVLIVVVHIYSFLVFFMWLRFLWLTWSISSGSYCTNQCAFTTLALNLPDTHTLTLVLLVVYFSELYMNCCWLCCCCCCYCCSIYLLFATNEVGVVVLFCCVVFSNHTNVVNVTFLFVGLTVLNNHL